MSDPTADFFDGLGRRGHERLLAEATGTIRFDLEHDRGIDRWFLTIRQGDVRVSGEEPEADTVIRTTRALFDRLATGEAQMYAAWVRNDLRVEGDIRLGRFFLRILPGPPGAQHPRMFASERSRRA